MKTVTKKYLLWSITIITAASWAYSAATRFTDFLFTSKLDKISILGSLLCMTFLLSAWVFWVLLSPFIRKLSKKTIALSLVLSALLVAAVLFKIYQFPPFPENHSLTITAMGEKNPLSDNSKVEIVSISTVNFPDQELRRIPVNQLEYEGTWQSMNNGYGLLANNGQIASVSLNRFMQAGIDIIFRSDPQDHLGWNRLRHRSLCSGAGDLYPIPDTQS